MRRECRDDDYRKLYRINRNSPEWLANYFLNNNGETRGGALSAVAKMKIFLRVVSDPGYQNSVAEECGVHQTTVSKIYTSVMNSFLNKTKIWIRFPTSAEEIAEAKQQWSQRNEFPNNIGVIDCTHVRIPKCGAFGDE